MRPKRGIGGLLLAVTAFGTLTAAGFAPITAHAAPGSVSVRAVARGGSLPNFGNPHGHAFVPKAGRAINTSHPDRVIGNGTATSCTSAAVVRAVAKGGKITFNCGTQPVTIAMHATAKVSNTSHHVTLDGGGKVTLDGLDKRRILFMNTCVNPAAGVSDCYNVQWPQLTVQNLTLTRGNSLIKQNNVIQFGGGAIFALGGRVKVVNSRFIDNRCYHVGPDLGGAGVRALAEWQNKPVYITNDTFHGGRCSNGSALSSISVSWVVLNSVMTDNNAIGSGANPAAPGYPGGGSGGAIYNDGGDFTLTIDSTVMHNNHANAGGGAIFFVSDNNTGSMTIKDSTLHDNPSLGFWTRPYPGIFYQSAGHPPTIINSMIN